LSDNGITLNVQGLEKLLKALKQKPPTARVGILGQSPARVTEDGQPAMSNAQIGAFHEFGTSTHPVRSFLRLPISALLNKELAASGLLKKEQMAEVLKTGTVIPWLKKVVLVAEKIVLGAFDTGGYGTWIPSNMARKKNFQTLIETQQLRNSITSEVKE
jgi:hypothetical protein